MLFSIVLEASKSLPSPLEKRFLWARETSLFETPLSSCGEWGSGIGLAVFTNIFSSTHESTTVCALCG